MLEVSVWNGSTNKIWKEMISESNIKFEIARRLEVQEKERIKQTSVVVKDREWVTQLPTTVYSQERGEPGRGQQQR